jgi:hypothetical protein
MNWYLKKAQGETVYGPVDETSLEAWAADGRVAPDDLVSPDRRQWKPAPQIPALNMEWMVELEGGGPYGPLHVMALRELVREGQLRPETKIRSSKSGQTTTVAGVLASAGEKTAAKEPEWLAQVEAARKAAVQFEAAAKKTAAELKTAQDQLTRIGQERDEAHKQIQEWKEKAARGEAALKNAVEQLATVQSETKETAARCAAEAKAAQDSAAQARQEAERLRREAEDQAKQDAAKARDRAAQAGKEAADARSTAQRQASELQAAAGQLAAARAENEKWKDQYARARAAAVEAEKARQAEKAKPAEAQALVPRDQLEEALRRIAHLERSYKQALQTVHRNLAARVGASQAAPPEQLQRRDIA